MKTPLSVVIDMSPADINPKFYQYINWNAISTDDMKSIPDHICLFASPIPKLINRLKSQKHSNISDEEVLAVFARLARNIGEEKDVYINSTNITKLLMEFVSIDFIKKYYRQILSILSINKAGLLRAKALLVVLNILPFDELYNIPYHLLNIDHLNSPKASGELRFNILKKSGYLCYTLLHNIDIPECMLVLKSNELKEIGLPAPYDISVSLLNTLNSPDLIKYLKNYIFIDNTVWDGIIDLYQNGRVEVTDLHDIWTYFIYNISNDVHEHKTNIYSLNSNSDLGVFNKEDF